MRTTIDRGGRVVIPKSIRDALHLEPETEVSVTEEDGRVVIEPVMPTVRLTRAGKGLVAVTDGPMTPLTVDQVRDALERARRR